DKLGRGFMMAGVIDLARLRRSGRVPIPPLLTRAIRPIFGLLRLVPTFILEQGRPRLLGIVSEKNLNRHLLDAALSRVGFQEPVRAAVAYTGPEARDAARGLQQAVMSHPGFRLAAPVDVAETSPVIGVHAGSGLAALGVVGLGYQSLPTPVMLRFFVEVQKELGQLHQSVNAINLFPVRDGDTGSNLLLPLKGVEEGIDQTLPCAEALFQVATRVARRGGGYSGGALAAYLLGFAQYVQGHETGPELRLATLVGALRAGTDRAYGYFGSDAKEGTMLSVMRACDQAAERAFQHRPTFRNVLTSAYLAATDELLNPRIQEVEVLRRERLADAGGFGWTLILWSLLKTLGLSRDPVLLERNRLVEKEVRQHAVFAQRLIYRRQPPELRGFCVEGCVQGEVAEELRREFASLDNRLPEPKMTFNTVNGTTHFHIHVSEGLEDEVRRIASRFGYVVESRPPTRLAKRRREIYHFRMVNFFAKAKRIPGYISYFFVNWVAYAVLFPVMWFRAHRRLKALETELEGLRLTGLGLSILAEESERALLIVDALGKVCFANGAARGGLSSPKSGQSVDDFLPQTVAIMVRQNMKRIGPHNPAPIEFQAEGWHGTIIPLQREQRLLGFLLSLSRGDGE
ncbi:MAG: DAK2 domain-containing protein, partial [candidate division WOR-3 bacterium]